MWGVVSADSKRVWNMGLVWLMGMADAGVGQVGRRCDLEKQVDGFHMEKFTF
jgi:hypothetical protein